MTWAELERLLKRETDFRHTGERKDHSEWTNLKTGEQITLGRHKSQEIKAKTLHTILKQVGLK